MKKKNDLKRNHPNPQRTTYLGSGQSVFRLIAWRRDTFVFQITSTVNHSHCMTTSILKTDDKSYALMQKNLYISFWNLVFELQFCAKMAYGNLIEMRHLH